MFYFNQDVCIVQVFFLLIRTTGSRKQPEIPNETNVRLFNANQPPPLCVAQYAMPVACKRHRVPTVPPMHDKAPSCSFDANLNLGHRRFLRYRLWRVNDDGPGTDEVIRHNFVHHVRVLLRKPSHCIGTRDACNSNDIQCRGAAGYTHS